MFCKLFADNKYKWWFQRNVKKQCIKDVTVECVPNGIIVNEHLHGFGIFSEKFKFVKSSLQIRKNNGQFKPSFNHNDIPYVDEDVVFIGNVYPQFGHFLLEHMNRAYALLDKKYTHMKVVLINNKDVDPVPEYMFTLLQYLGIKKTNILILNKTTQFKNVYVPEQAFNLPVFTSYKFADTFTKISKTITCNQKYDKVYVSRCALKSRKTFGEEKVQHVFEKNGYKVIYPENLSLDKQIAIIKNCKYLAGCAGTALHLALFMKPGGTVIQIKRNKILKDNADTQYLINTVKQLNSIFICGSIEKKKTEHCSFAPQIIGINQYLKQFFDENNFKYSKSDLQFNKTGWNEYIKFLNEYQKENGDLFIIKCKRVFVRLSSCLIPGRYNRSVYRRWIKKKLIID